MGIIVVILIIGFAIIISTYVWRINRSKASDEYLERMKQEQVKQEKIKQEQYEERIKNLKKIKQLIIEHSRTLAIKKQQLVIKDDYGIVDVSRWSEEKQYFIDAVLTPACVFGGYAGLVIERKNTMLEMIENAVTNYISSKQLDFEEINQDMSPIKYEQYCARLLEENLWQARTTKVTGDQGADIIAEKNGIVLVLQCKLYSSPVGNKAVQEVFSAKEFNNATAAAVVSNAGYTPAARQLASKLNVFLLHHFDLSQPDLEERIRS